MIPIHNHTLTFFSCCLVCIRIKTSKANKSNWGHARENRALTLGAIGDIRGKEVMVKRSKPVLPQGFSMGCHLENQCQGKACMGRTGSLQKINS